MITETNTTTDGTSQGANKMTDSLTAKYLVTVETDQGDKVVRIAGSFTMPSALHLCLQMDAVDDFEFFLSKSIVNTGKVLFLKYVQSVREKMFAERDALEKKGGSRTNADKGSATQPKSQTPDTTAKPGVKAEFNPPPVEESIRLAGMT